MFLTLPTEGRQDLVQRAGVPAGRGGQRADGSVLPVRGRQGQPGRQVHRQTGQRAALQRQGHRVERQWTGMN